MFVFGDESDDAYTFVADLCTQRDASTLAISFLDQVCAALNLEIDALPSRQRRSLPKFANIKELNDRYLKAKIKDCAVDSALLCIGQLAHYIDHCERATKDLYEWRETCTIGLGVGVFAAFAVDISPSLSVLVQNAVDLVVVAFRTGASVSAMARELSDVSTSQGWKCLIPNATETKIARLLEDFNVKNGFSTTTRAYISAITPDSIIISGPPPTLDAFFKSQKFESNPLALPSHGPYHAPHLYSDAVIDNILQIGSYTPSKSLRQLRSNVSNSTMALGDKYEGKDGVDYLRDIVRRVLMKPLRIQEPLEYCLSKLSDKKSTGCYMTLCGPKGIENSIFASTLEAKSHVKIVHRETSEKDDPRNLSDSRPSGRKKLAIVGMSGRFPDAASHEKLWELLEKGLDVHRPVPADRFDVQTHVDPTGKAINTSHTPFGCWIKDPGLFDPRFFEMSPREAFQTDPMQRLALTTAYEALEMSGYVPNRTRSTQLDRIGTFYGQTSDDWREINAAQDVDTYFITGGVRAFGPGRINYHFGFSGPSFSIDTACSSSAAALQLACTSLWASDCDTAVVGGLSCMTNSDIFAGLSRGQFLSKTGPCATFDNDADGYCRADGVGTVIIKRLEDAVADKDNILAVILGTATNHSADAISITHPHGETQELLSRSILDKAGISPLDIDYVEMHGTGTQAGDGTEMLSVTNIFAPKDRPRTQEQPLFIGSVKANVGHGEAASGVTALMKCLLMLQHDTIPPHVGIKKSINQGFPKDLGERNVNIAFHKTPFRRKPGRPRRVYINNFSAAGGNTGLLIEDGPSRAQASIDSRPMHLVTVTGKSKAALIRNAQRLISHVAQNSETSLPDLGYTTTARRIQHNWRMSVPAASIAQLKDDLAASLSRDNFVPIPSVAPKVAFVFTGQGSHYSAMGKELYETSSIFKDNIDNFERIAQIHGFDSFLGLIDGSIEDTEIVSSLAVQLALVSFEMALARLWSSWGVNPSTVVGHSLGEYAALNIAGVLSSSDTIYLVGRRAQLLMQKCSPGTHAMLAVQGPSDAIENQKSSDTGVCTIAAINGPQELVYSGPIDDIKELATRLQKLAFKCTQLNTPFAFHSAQVDAILQDFEKAAHSVSFHQSRIPIISSLLGRVMDELETVDSTYLRDHAREPVKFYDGISAAQKAGLVGQETIWIEVGPQPVCTQIMQKAFGQQVTGYPTMRRGQSPYKTLVATLSALHTAGVNVDWNEYHRDFIESLHMLDLPSYSFDDKNYWIQYEGDWCLTKGRPALEKPKVAAISKLSTSSVHAVIEEKISRDSVVVTTESDLGRADLRGVVSGHVVNGVLLCPSSLYADMAITVCEYAYSLIRPDEQGVAINVAHMQVPKSLLAHQDGRSQILRLTAKVDLTHAELSFSTGSGKEKVEHATCDVLFGQREAYLTEWQKMAYLIQARVDWLKQASSDGGAHTIGRGLAYKLFSALVDYDAKYRGMAEVILHSDNMEATSRVEFQTTENDGSFVCSPYWIDSVAHISGFIVNGSDAINSQETVYISHGWESLQVAERFRADKTYRSYVKMQAQPNNIYAGDVYVFDGDRIVAKVGGLKFQGIRRKVLNMLLPPANSTSRAAPAQSFASETAISTAVEKVTPLDTKTSIESISGVIAWSQVVEILSEEIGVGIEELVDNIAFSDLGVDSLMGLTVCGRMREELEIDINSHEFQDHPTIGEFRKFFSKFETPVSNSYASSTTASSSQEGSLESSEIGSDATTPSVEDVIKVPVITSKSPERVATSVLLQGNSRRATKCLWMVPDGGGSATSYIDIPDLSPQLAVWGLNSPFMKVPEEYNVGVHGMAERFIHEMKRRQPTGPYLLAGWSAGGVIAFEMVNQLTKSGDPVEQLILIDAPCPDIIEPLPSSLHRWFASIGLLGENGADLASLPPWLLPHFAASVTALSNYKAEKIEPVKCPLVTAIWCEDGVCKLPSDPRPDPFPYGHAQFLLDNRTDFGPGLWERYLDEGKILLRKTSGNHFSMMRGTHGKMLGDIMRASIMKTL